MDRLVQHLLDRLSSSPGPDGQALGREEETELAARAVGGDRTAYGLLVRCHYARVYATARHLVGNHEDAEDLAQETFVRAHRALSWYRAEGSFAGWLRRILVHLAADRFRRAGRTPEARSLESLELEVPAQREGLRGPLAEAGARELEGLVERALASLPARLRIPLVLRTLDGLDYDEVARATGVTPATARTQVSQARRALARLLARHLGPDDEPSTGGIA